MIPEGLPLAARKTIQAVAKAHDLPMEDLFKPWPRERWVDEARVEAIGRLSNQRTGDGRWMFSQVKLAKWFDVRRERISIYARRWPGYTPRRKLGIDTTSAD